MIYVKSRIRNPRHRVSRIFADIKRETPYVKPINLPIENI